MKGMCVVYVVVGLHGCRQPILAVCESLSLESRAVSALGSI